LAVGKTTGRDETGTMCLGTPCVLIER
jgi:hypothetical protein